MITSSSLDLLEFGKLLRIIAAKTHSEASAAAVIALRPLQDHGAVRQRQSRIADLFRLSADGTPLRLGSFADIRNLFPRIRPAGAVLEGVEIAAFLPVFDIIADIMEQMKERGDLVSILELTGRLNALPDLRRILVRSVDSQGAILDSASPALAQIRADIRKLEARIRRKLEEMVQGEDVSVFLQDDFITQRSGRWVIPVRMDSKGQVAGVVHDVSKSGETAFVEPLAIISLSNELENLTAEQKAEEIRILRNLTARLRDSLELIEEQYDILIEIDLLAAMARFGEGMAIPAIGEPGSIDLVNGRHPLLALALRKLDAEREVVPLSIRLGGERSVMVITGSNAGGKTIALKTIGLLTLMALTGMPVPADSSSVFPMVNDLLMDIGDEQSIEANLSTFSAHIAHISEILKKADNASLVLIDELGTGTDPAEGAAIACAVLKEIREKGALLFASTHLMDIKGYVHRSEGMINASMEFDQRTLTPLYRLRLGEPGQSHALDIARRYGLPDSVIESAKALLGGVKVEFDKLIRDLTEKRAHYEQAAAEVERARSALAEKERSLDLLLAEAKRGHDEALRKAYSEAGELVDRTRREMHSLLDEARRQEKDALKAAIREAEARQKEIAKGLRQLDQADDTGFDPAILKAGDMVFVVSLGTDAAVVAADQDHLRAKVRAGSIDVEVPFEALRKARGKAVKKKESFGRPSHGDAEAAPAKLMLVGHRVDDALMQLEPFLNHAALSGLREVVMVHGIGTGSLAKAVREHLKGHPLVESFRKGEQNEGGAGVTVAMLK